MLPSHRRLPLPYHFFDLAGRQAERLGFLVGDLRLKTLFKDAQQRTGLADFGHPYFMAGLEKLLSSLEKDAHLRFYGRLVMRCVLTNYLCQRLLFVDALKHNPGLFTPLTKPPIVITGLHRSGTTFLHRLLALDPANAGISFWRLYRPLGSSGLLDLRKIKACSELCILNPIFPGIKHKHCIRPFAPEECCWMLGLTFHSMVFWILAPVINYLNWLWERDLSEMYREYALLLQVQQSFSPDQRLVLKAPDHMPHLDLLLEAIPGARIVQLHRDPATCVLSLSSLFYSTHIALSERVQPRILAETHQTMMANAIRANRKVRENPSVNQYVLDIEYEDFLNDPAGTVHEIYTHFGLNLSEVFVEKLCRCLHRQERGDNRIHHYAADQFGLHEQEIRAFFDNLLIEA
ncbi:MAG: sulfotransferase family protein [Brevefilum sp.]